MDDASHDYSTDPLPSVSHEEYVQEFGGQILARLTDPPRPMSKNEKYLRLCVAGGELFTTCSRSAVFAIIVSEHGRVVGTGYNGSPPGMPHCVDGACPRAQQLPEFRAADHSDCIAIHAEENALLYSDFSLRHDGTLYVNKVPCFNCAKKIAGSGLAHVVFTDPEFDNAGDMLDEPGPSFLMEAELVVVAYALSEEGAPLARS